MTEALLRMLCGATLGLALVLLLRRPARRVFGAGAAFTLWLLPLVLALAPLLPQQFAPRAMIVVPGLTVMPHLAASVAVQPVAIDWVQWLLVFWLAGVAVALLRLVVHYARLLRGLRHVPETWTRVLGESVPDLDPQRVRVHDAGPAVLWALPHPLVLLPADFMDRFGNAATRALVLRHELTHVRRGDAWWSLALELATALLWFHPLAWIARPRFRLDQELACDAASLRALPERHAGYARALLDSVAARPAPALLPWLTEPQLKERIAMIARIQPRALRRRAGFIVMAALLACGAYLAGGQTPLQAATAQAGAASMPSVDPSYKNHNPPAYPAQAIAQGQQGTVILDVTVDATGRVTGVQVDQHGTDAPAALQTAAIAAARQWKFNPGHKDGKAIGGVLQVPVNFSLNNETADAGHSKPCPVGDIFDVQASKCISDAPHFIPPASAR